MILFNTRSEAGRVRSADSRKSNPGRFFWCEGGKVGRLEDRVLLTLTFTSFPIPLVGLVEPTGITTGPDGNLWFTETGAGRIGRVTPSEALTEFALSPIPPSASAVGGTPAEPPQPQGIAAGPDGALWFTTSDSLIGRISTTGAITEFPAHGLTLSNSTITAGSDGNLWFSGVPGKVGRITPSGTVTEFAVPPTAPPPDSPPGTPPTPTTVNALVAGPDGAVWFTGLAGEIGRFTTSGTLTEFALPSIPPSSGASPQTQPTPVTASGITAGPDGALWFLTFEPDGEIGRITTAGTVTEFPMPDHLTAGTTISAGPDGDLWFTASDAGSGAEGTTEESTTIARITPAGTVTSFPIPGTFSTVGGLTSGPDGNLWFTESEDGRTPGQQPAIGEITPSGQATLHTLPQGMTLDPNLGVPVNPGAVTTGSDGALWFTENTGIGRMTTSASVQQFAMSTSGETPVQIIAGPGGAIWFTLTGTDADGNNTSSIGRITTAGMVATYSLPEGSSVSGITAGPDGNVWFTDVFSDPKTSNGSTSAYIGRITPQGGIKKFNLDARDVTLTGVTTGPDRNLWFTGEANPSNPGTATPFIGRITTRGELRIFDVAPGRGYPGSYGAPAARDPMTGPDGQIWFEAWVKNTWGIVRISTSGKLDRVLPNGKEDFRSTGDLVAAPGGRVFFVDGSNLGIATRSGSVTTQDVTGASFGNGSYNNGTQMTAGPNGNLWFTDGVSALERITGLDTPNGGLDAAYRVNVGNSTTNARPTFAGLAKPGAEVTLFAREQGATQPVPIGQVQANRKNGSWRLTSHVALSVGNYEVTAVQHGDPRPPSVLYSLEPDSSGNLSSALVIAVPPKATPKGTTASHHASQSRRSSGH